MTTSVCESMDAESKRKGTQIPGIAARAVEFLRARVQYLPLIDQPGRILLWSKAAKQA